MTRRLAAIMVADVVGYSRLMEEDEGGTLAMLTERRESIVVPLVGKHAGRIVKYVGDGVLIEFASAVNAMACALAIQDAMREVNVSASASRQIVLRMGLNIGDLIEEGDDIYGDAVNVAARLEALAEPGNICISAKVHEEVKGKLEYAWTEGGLVKLKNIDRPVHLFHVSTSVKSALPKEPQIKPSIAVLPFDNMSGQPDQVYFTDGISEDIITALSRFSSLFVIARNSSFSYRGKPIDIVQIGRELNVEYVLEGSIRQAGNKIRVNAQLISARTGGHVWAEKYDRDLTDIFMVQDELTRAIVTTLTAYVTKISSDQIMRQPIERLAAYDLYLRGRDLLRKWVPSSDGGRCIAEARAIFQRGADADSRYAPALVGLAECDVCSWVEPSPFGTLMQEYQNPDILAQALRRAQKAVSLEGDLDEAHAMLGWVLHWSRRVDEAVRQYERAFALNPNMTDRHYGNVLSKAGRSEEAITVIERMAEHDPFHNEELLAHLGHALYLLQRYDEARSVLRRCIRGAPEWRPLHVWLAASCAQLGDVEEAGIAVGNVLRIQPTFSVAAWVAFEPYARREDAAHLGDGLRKAGLPG
jgi:adenylate cyclase